MYGQLFSKKTKERSQSILYRVSQTRFSVRDSIQSENMEMLSRTCRLVLSRTLRIVTMNKSLNILFIYIKKKQTDNFFQI